VLGIRPMVWLGGISYSVYLWHWPLIVFAETRWPDLPAAATIVVGLSALPLAYATKRLLEDPMRFAPGLTRRTSLALLMGVAGMSLSVVVGVLVARSVPSLATGAHVPGAQALVANPRGDEWRMIANPSRLYTKTGSVTPDPAVATRDVPSWGGCQMPEMGTDMRTDCVRGDATSEVTVAMIGDSKMAQWYPAIQTIAKREGWRLEIYTKSACAVSTVGVPDYCASYNRRVLDWFEQHGAPDYAFVSQRGSSYDEATGGLIDGLSSLKRLGTEVVVVADNIPPAQDAVYRCVELNPDDYHQCDFDRSTGVASSGSVSLREAARRLNLPFVDLNDWICPPGDRCPSVIAHTLIYRQGSHITRTYIKSMTPILHRELTRIGVANVPVHDIRLKR
jgi:hypothetical protein